jgi:hypothetical protein
MFQVFGGLLVDEVGRIKWLAARERFIDT